MLIEKNGDLEQVLKEAEQIKAGQNPATVTQRNEYADTVPASSAGAQEDAEAAITAAAPSPSFEAIADLLCLLCDWPFVRAFGASAQLPEPFRSEARKAWGEVLEKYMPAVVAQAGPFGVLCSIYSIHGGGLYLQWRMTASVSPSSAKEAPANQP